MRNKELFLNELKKRISRNKERKIWEEIPEKRNQLIIEGQLLGELKHFVESMQEKDNTPDWLKELESMPDEEVRERLEKVNTWYNEQFVNKEPASEDLELAAKRILGGYSSMGTFQDGKMYTEECMLDICMAGANWQKEKDVRDLFMSDNRNFKKCYELGKADMKQQMMKDAVDATIPIHGQIWIDNDTSYKAGDKVKVIIIKED